MHQVNYNNIDNFRNTRSCTRRPYTDRHLSWEYFTSRQTHQTKTKDEALSLSLSLLGEYYFSGQKHKSEIACDCSVVKQTLCLSILFFIEPKRMEVMASAWQSYLNIIITATFMCSIGVIY